jgi:hypothetical protein
VVLRKACASIQLIYDASTTSGQILTELALSHQVSFALVKKVNFFLARKKMSASEKRKIYCLEATNMNISP